MDAEQQEDRMSVSLAWKDFFGKFGRQLAVACSLWLVVESS